MAGTSEALEGLPSKAERLTPPRSPALGLYRVRFSVRWMMAAVAAAALVCMPIVVIRRYYVYRNRASHHYRMVGPWFSHFTPQENAYFRQLAVRRGRMSPERQLWHQAMQEKYRRAAERPWLSVPADPPEPP